MDALPILIDDIIWLDTIVDKIAWKHGVLPKEVEEVLSGNFRIFKRESGKVEGEDLFNVLGTTEGGRYLSIFFIKKLNNKALIITARDMKKRERRRYEKK
ncbi:MAG: BrnT family toxin [Nitrospirota bacterium]